MFYTIDTDLNVIAHATRPADQEGRICFTNLEELRSATANWPMQGFVNVWNDLAGLPGFFTIRKVAKFENRGIATKRLFAAIDAGLGKTDVPSDEQIRTAAKGDRAATLGKRCGVLRNGRDRSYNRSGGRYGT